MATPTRPVGDLIREWRQRRRLSQLDLACDAEVSTKHLSFLETGRAQPSREMLLHLADRLTVPLRDRNMMLRAAGFAPSYQERTIDDPDFHAVRQGIDLLLSAQEPNPALAVDRHWKMVAANKGVANLIAGADPLLLAAPINFLRLCLHPAGLAPRIINLTEWRRHMVERLQHRIAISGDTVLYDLVEEIRDYPPPPASPGRAQSRDHERVAVPFRLATIHGPLSFFCATTVFGTPVDITLSELSIETFLPADPATATVMRGLMDGTAVPLLLPTPTPTEPRAATG